MGLDMCRLRSRGERKDGKQEGKDIRTIIKYIYCGDKSMVMRLPRDSRWMNAASLYFISIRVSN